MTRTSMSSSTCKFRSESGMRPDQVAQNFIQSDLEKLHGQRLNNLSGQPVPILDCTPCGKLITFVKCQMLHFREVCHISSEFPAKKLQLLVINSVRKPPIGRSTLLIDVDFLGECPASPSSISLVDQDTFSYKSSLSQAKKACNVYEQENSPICPSATLVQ